MARIIQALDVLGGSGRVVTIAMARAGEKSNVIADTGFLSGTIRVLDPERVARTLDEIRRVVSQVCEAVGMRAEVRFGRTCPPVVIDEGMFELFMRVGRRLLGRDGACRLPEPSMGSEDFGYFLDASPGLIFRLGMGDGWPELHNAAFDFNDGALNNGVLMLAGLAAELCGKGDGE
jgi:metal-dependent amidase/aminoacylase/carboxypeptidase family protein